MAIESEVLPVEGPDWAPHDLLDVRGGLFPLSVETHFIATIAKLLPGTTTVTTLARYYSLHAYVATVAEDRHLDQEDATQLLRRCEVVVAGATIMVLQPGEERPHAYDAIQPRMDADGYLDVAGLAARPGGYSDQRKGFLPAYIGSENDTGLLTGNALVPGPRADREVLRAAFQGLVDLAEKDRAEFEELIAASHLSINALSSSPDGPWLSRVLCGVDVAGATPNDQVRNDTARLLGRALVLDPAEAPLESFQRLVMYGPALSVDPVASRIPVAAAWRGCLFRHQSVGAWRILWHWTVEQIVGETDPRELVRHTEDALPRGTLAQFLSDLPPTTDAAGHPAPAEDRLRQQGLPAPTLALGILALGARRSDEFTGRARDGFADSRPTVLSPLWMKNWLAERRDRDMTVVAADLVEALLDRAKRVAFRKMRIRPDGTVWLPTRVHERNGLLYAVGRESPRNVGVRLEQYARILRSLGVLERADEETILSSAGTDLLEVKAP
jgi:hypothetical protein